MHETSRCKLLPSYKNSVSPDFSCERHEPLECKVQDSPFTHDAWHDDYVCKACGRVFETDEEWCAPAADGKFEWQEMRYCPLCGYPADMEIAELKKNSLYGKQATESRRYAHGPIECIDAVKAALSPEEWRGFVKGNVLKYVWREAYKGGDCDLEKALDYLGRYLGKGGCVEPVEEV